MTLLLSGKKAWIFQANPKKYAIFKELADETMEGGTWTVAQHTKDISSGDIGLVWISGKNAGIYAVFDVVSDPQVMVDDEASRKYWLDQKDADVLQYRIRYRYRIKLSHPLLKSEIQQIDGLQGLSILKFTRGTNFDVTDDERDLISREIETRENIKQDIGADIDDDEGLKLLREGKIHQFFGKRYERVPANRRVAMRIHGLACSVCGFDFERTYGERGRDYIEIHHGKPLSQFSAEEYVNPETDLFPVCANCHRMIHRRRDSVLSIEEMRGLVRGSKASPPDQDTT